jgi:hypothetical protein
MKLRDILFEEYIGKVNIGPMSAILYKNPADLSNCKPYLRGVILKNGDFYYINEDVVHTIIVNVLVDFNLMSKNSSRKWWEKPPKEFLCVARSWNTNEIYISESYEYSALHENSINFFVNSATKLSKKYNSDLVFHNTQI